MPIYEYECQECKHRLEVMQRISEDPLKTCPACAKDALRKLISAVGFQLKGTGWYETDFKNKGKPKAGNGESKDKDKDGATDAGAKDKSAKESTTSDGATSGGDKATGTSSTSSD